MSDFTVLRSLDGYCLVLDKKRIAGGKPDYRGENVLVDWTTEVAYGPVDDLAAENAKLRDELDLCLKCEECEAMLDCDECLRADASQKERKRVDYENAKLRELVRDMAAEIRGLGIDFARVGWCDYADRMSELGIEVDG